MQDVFVNTKTVQYVFVNIKRYCTRQDSLESVFGAVFRLLSAASLEVVPAHEGAHGNESYQGEASEHVQDEFKV